MFVKRSLTFCPILWAILFFLASLASPSAFAALSLPPPEAAKTASPQLIESYGKLPLSFEANRGQTDDQVKFLSRGQGYSLS
ncbi:MAG: hypothetical protein PHE55_13945 [Methylococcaceae bacterium]|nr:hypothetical protein [Methylococcaceae bacterium]